MSDNDAFALVGTAVFAALSFWSGLWWFGLLLVGLFLLLVVAALPASWPQPRPPVETQADRIEQTVRSIERGQLSD